MRESVATIQRDPRWRRRGFPIMGQPNRRHRTAGAHASELLPVIDDEDAALAVRRERVWPIEARDGPDAIPIAGAAELARDQLEGHTARGGELIGGRRALLVDAASDEQRGRTRGGRSDAYNVVPSGALPSTSGCRA